MSSDRVTGATRAGHEEDGGAVPRGVVPAGQLHPVRGGEIHGVVPGGNGPSRGVLEPMGLDSPEHHGKHDQHQADEDDREGRDGTSTPTPQRCGSRPSLDPPSPHQDDP